MKDIVSININFDVLKIIQCCKVSIDKKSKEKEDRLVAEAILFLKQSPNIMQTTFKRGESRAFRCYSIVNNRFFYILLSNNDLTKEYSCSYLVDMKNKKCYEIGKSGNQEMRMS